MRNVLSRILAQYMYTLAKMHRERMYSLAAVEARRTARRS